MDSSDPSLLIGARADDAADVRLCQTEGFMALAPGLRVYELRRADRDIPSPPQVKGGPFAEMRLAPSPAAAVAAAIGRRRAGSEQPIWQILRDVLGSAIYVVQATGVRIKDCHSDGRLVGGTPDLRREGEYARSRLVREDRELVASGAGATAGDDDDHGPMSDEWTSIDVYFKEAVAAIEVPSNSALQTFKADWCLVASVPRIEALASVGALKFDYVGASIVRFRDLLKMKDVGGEDAGGQFAYFLTRELVHDIFSVRRQQGFNDWLRFSTATLSFAGGLGSLSWLLSELATILI